MQAKIHHQAPIKWEDYKSDDDTPIPDPPPCPPPSLLLGKAPIVTNQIRSTDHLEHVNSTSGNKDAKMRRGTGTELNETARAFERFVSGEDDGTGACSATQ